jgi:thiol:disulfide interchange protein DsbC
MKRLILIAMTLLLVNCVANNAPDSQTQIKERLKANYDELADAEVSASAVKPLYEIKIDNTTLYTVDGDQIIVGLIYDNQKRLITPVYQRSFLPEQTPAPAQNPKTDLSFLDLPAAVKIGNGTHTVIEFTDVECPFCKRAETFFPEDVNATRYIFFIALDFHPGARPKAIHILCSSDKAAAYRDIMQDKIPTPLLECDEGKTLFELHKNYAEKLFISGTPMFYVDGALVEGADPAIVNMLR